MGCPPVAGQLQVILRQAGISPPCIGESQRVWLTLGVSVPFGTPAPSVPTQRAEGSYAERKRFEELAMPIVSSATTIDTTPRMSGPVGGAGPPIWEMSSRLVRRAITPWPALSPGTHVGRERLDANAPIPRRNTRRVRTRKIGPAHAAYWPGVRVSIPRPGSESTKMRS